MHSGRTGTVKVRSLKVVLAAISQASLEEKYQCKCWMDAMNATVRGYTVILILYSYLQASGLRKQCGDIAIKSKSSP